jgi:TorA maturation chaperone TorD
VTVVSESTATPDGGVEDDVDDGRQEPADAPDPTLDPDDGVAATDPSFLRARARTYDLLSACLDGDVETLRSGIDEGAFARLSAVFPVDLDPEPLSGSSLDEDALSVGYDNLFVVPGTHFVPPFASAHATDPSAEYESDSTYHDAGEAGELFGRPAAELSRLYDAASFEPTRGDGVPDHVAAAFEFLGALAVAEAESRERGDGETAAALRDVQRRTLSELGWLDAFHDAVRDEDSAEGVFATLVGVARSFAAWDARVGLATEDERPRTDADAPTDA